MVSRCEGLNVKDEELLITDGGQQAIDLVCKAFIRAGDSVALENPAYPGAISILTGARARILPVPVETDPERSGYAGLDVDALENILLQNRVKFICATPDFHNPTGTAMPAARRRRLIDLAARHQVPIIEDSVYARTRLRGSTLPPLRSLDTNGNVRMQIDSFSKIAFQAARRLVHWSAKRDRAAAPGEAID